MISRDRITNRAQGGGSSKPPSVDAAIDRWSESLRVLRSAGEAVNADGKPFVGLTLLEFRLTTLFWQRRTIGSFDDYERKTNRYSESNNIIMSDFIYYEDRCASYRLLNPSFPVYKLPHHTLRYLDAFSRSNERYLVNSLVLVVEAFCWHTKVNWSTDRGTVRTRAGEIMGRHGLEGLRVYTGDVATIAWAECLKIGVPFDGIAKDPAELDRFWTKRHRGKWSHRPSPEEFAVLDGTWLNLPDARWD